MREARSCAPVDEPFIPWVPHGRYRVEEPIISKPSSKSGNDDLVAHNALYNKYKQRIGLRSAWEYKNLQPCGKRREIRCQKFREVQKIQTTRLMYRCICVGTARLAVTSIPGSSRRRTTAQKRLHLSFEMRATCFLESR